MTLLPSDVGRRVVVRYRLDQPQNGASATDVLGELVALTDDVVAVRDRDGRVVEVDRSRVVAAKPIPARPVSRREIHDLEAAAAQGWRATETAELGGWLLRAAGGFTGRANSCLPLGEPGLALRAAVERVRRWYEVRDIVPSFQVPGVLGRGLDAALDAEGWPAAAEDVLVMTAPVSAVLAGERSELPAVTIGTEPDDDWLAAYHYRGGVLPPNAADVLRNAETVGFAGVDDGRMRVAIARGAVTTSPGGTGWLGVTAVEVHPSARRRGLASHVMAALARWGAAHSASACYVQVSEGNAGARAAYQKLGFGEHHRYHYRRLTASE